MRDVHSREQSVSAAKRRNRNQSRGKSSNIENTRRSTTETKPRQQKSAHRLGKNNFVVSEQHQYVVRDIISSNPRCLFEVYRVTQSRTNIDYALKVETDLSSNRLKAELQVLRLFEFAKESKRYHFPLPIDRGQALKLRFVVMDLLGPTLLDIRRGLLRRKDFSRITACHIASQTFEALTDLHDLGIVHREISLSNFCVGLPPKDDVLFLIGFTSAKDFKGKGPIKENSPRQQTVYAPRSNCPLFLEDFESWLYLVVDVFNQFVVNWAHLKNKGEIDKAKERLLQFGPQQLQQCNVPGTFEKMSKHFFHAKGPDSLNFALIRECLVEMREKEGVASENVCLDWVRKRVVSGKIEQPTRAREHPKDLLTEKKEKEKPMPVPKVADEEQIQKALAELMTTTESRRDDDIGDMQKNNLINQLKKKQEELRIQKWKANLPKPLDSGGSTGSAGKDDELKQASDALADRKDLHNRPCQKSAKAVSPVDKSLTCSGRSANSDSDLASTQKNGPLRRPKDSLGPGHVLLRQRRSNDVKQKKQG
ncbi:hypothetical protein QR680_017042 [Steinernema hermaphroditum]|uniref:Protein kinase domain-containing protein n=1 Tax=Steinernema hermaphroditum TaxID=289476 RepID=A0AA39HFI3_9BILA|nr:hypothetical protein QR680_017042 [Steinernema hermaphroditum]